MPNHLGWKLLKEREEKTGVDLTVGKLWIGTEEVLGTTKVEPGVGEETIGAGAANRVDEPNDCTGARNVEDPWIGAENLGAGATGAAGIARPPPNDGTADREPD